MELCLYLDGVHKRKIYLLQFTFTVYYQLRLQMEVLVMFTPSHFTCGQRVPGTDLTGSWFGPRSGLDVSQRSKTFCPCQQSNHDSSVVRPAAW